MLTSSISAHEYIRARNRAQIFFTGTHNNFEIISAFKEPGGLSTHPIDSTEEHSNFVVVIQIKVTPRRVLIQNLLQEIQRKQAQSLMR